jgi:hypothetical protein
MTRTRTEGRPHQGRPSGVLAGATKPETRAAPLCGRGRLVVLHVGLEEEDRGSEFPAHKVNRFDSSSRSCPQRQTHLNHSTQHPASRSARQAHRTGYAHRNAPGMSRLSRRVDPIEGAERYESHELHYASNAHTAARVRPRR